MFKSELENFKSRRKLYRDENIEGMKSVFVYFKLAKRQSGGE